MGETRLQDSSYCGVHHQGRRMYSAARAHHCDLGAACARCHHGEAALRFDGACGEESGAGQVLGRKHHLPLESVGSVQFRDMLQMLTLTG